MNLQVMQNAQMQIQALLDSLNRDRDRRLVLQGQLADVQAADPTPIPVRNQGSDDCRRRLRNREGEETAEDMCACACATRIPTSFARPASSPTSN